MKIRLPDIVLFVVVWPIAPAIHAWLGGITAEVAVDHAVVGIGGAMALLLVGWLDAKLGG